MVILKIQYDSYESGEFTEEQTVKTEALLKIFEENTQIINTRRSFTINKPYVNFFIQKGENYLRIAHFAKDAFSVQYCNDPDNKLYSGNFYKKSVRNIITHFSENNFDYLNKSIPHTAENEASLIKLFLGV